MRCIRRDVKQLRVTFYREELFRHWQCLEQQREQYSDKAIADIERALGKLMLRVDSLCSDERGQEVVAQLLCKIDGVTRLSSWSKSTRIH
jgi:DNA topoisomerase VI subunit A